jgi:hypothetical protein
VGQCCLCCPGSIWAVGDLWLASVNFDWRLLDVATTKDAWLEVLVLKRFAVEAKSLQRGVSFNCTGGRVNPVDIRSPDGTISLIVVEYFCGCAVKLLSNKIVPWNLFVVELSTLWSDNEIILRAGRIECLILSKKSFSALRLATQNFSVNWVLGCTCENRWFKCISESFLGIVLVLIVENIGFPCVGIPFRQYSLRGKLWSEDGPVLDSWNVQRVWVLVRGACDSSRKWLFKKDVLVSAGL